MGIPLILPGFKYLIESRKLTEETIRAFDLGYLDKNGMPYIGADFKGQLPAMPVSFRNSVLFPIEDVYGNVVSVSARPLGVSASKYINTSYEKADHLYGLAHTWKDCLQQQSAYIVEGNLSLLTPWQHGVKNIVAMLGSNISHTQICLLSRYVKKVVFVSDKDKAGEKFIEKLRKHTIAEKFYDSDLQFCYIDLPEGSDPDDYFVKRGATLADFKSLPEKELKL